eukprot:4266498-Pyramimonas_sp.AAC.1
MAGLNVFVLSLNILELFQNCVEGFHRELLFIANLILSGRVVSLLADPPLTSWGPAPPLQSQGWGKQAFEELR